MLLLLGLSLAASAATLTSVQSVTTRSVLSTSPVTVTTFDASGDTLAANIFGNSITFFTKSNGDFGSGVSIPFTDAVIKKGMFSPIGSWLAVSGSSNNIYLLSSSDSTYTVRQTISETSTINSLAWATNGQTLFAGLSDGKVVALTYSSSSGQFSVSQVITTTHSDVQRVTGTKSSFATCGPDSNVLIFDLDQNTGLY
jgi:hypothetical protein